MVYSTKNHTESNKKQASSLQMRIWDKFWIKKSKQQE